MTRFDGLVLAGGGSRCFWQLGFLSVVGDAIDLRPQAVAAVSAGSAMACAHFAGHGDEVLHDFIEAVSNNPRNFYPDKLLSRHERAFPQEAMYRAALRRLVDEPSLARLKAGSPIYVVVARPPAFLPAAIGLVVGLGAYNIEKRIREPIHPTAGRLLGFSAEAIDVRTCADADALGDLVLQSSCTPPMTRLMRRDGGSVLDGGVVDNVPVFALPGTVRHSLVLLSRPYKRPLPRRHDRVYVQPSRSVGISPWDYANPAGVQAAYDLGVADAGAFLSELSQRRLA